ncbi:MAG TPA: sodium:proton antiporter [Thermoanaerobaculia bacterium]
MTFAGWMAVVGALLLTMALSSAFLRNLPISTSAIYLAAGIALGPLVFGLVRLDIGASAGWFERLTEIAVIVSLFVGGLRLRLPLRDPAWRAAYVLAGPVMLLSIAGVALAAYWLFGLSAPIALLVGAVLAPTDPVLASAISVNDAKDHDRLRYGISGEAGLNDGMAFPFVIFALLWAEHGEAGAWIGKWALHRVLWAIPTALLLGFFLGRGVGRLAIFLRSRHRDTTAPSDFLALALILLAYVFAEVISAWGFLAVFAAGVGLRGAEIKVVRKSPHPEHRRQVEEKEEAGELPHPPAEHLVGARVEAEALDEPAVAAGVLVGQVISFGDTLERLLEVLLVVMVGVALADAFDPRAVLLALALFCIIRPLTAMLCLAGSPTSTAQRLLMGWFGIRGIGSLYYLSYALRHHPAGEVERVIPIVITIIAASVLLHGISSRPLLHRYERSLEK